VCSQHLYRPHGCGLNGTGNPCSKEHLGANRGTVEVADYTAACSPYDSAFGRDKKFDCASAFLLKEAVVRNELVGPGDGITGFVLAGGVHDEKAHARGIGCQCLVHELRAGLGDETILGIVDAQCGAGVLRVDAQADGADIVRLRVGDDLDGGFLLLRLLGSASFRP
jgi:hypothetical protein